MPSYSITYARKDTLVKNFLEIETDVPISNMVELAIEYLYKTGSYMPLCTVSVIDEHPDKKTKNIYISPKSDAYRFIKETQEQGKSAKKIFCEIIENGVDIGDYTDKITQKDYLLKKKELWGLTNKNVIHTRKTQDIPSAVKDNKDRKNELQQDMESKTEKVSDEIKPVSTKTEISQDTTNPDKKQTKQKINFADQFITSF